MSAGGSAVPRFTGRIGVIGAGALGALYGARMANVGYDVHFLMRSDHDAVRRDGLRIYSAQGDFTIHPPVYRTAAEMGVCDLLIVGLKVTDNGAFPELLGPTVGPHTVVLTLQNGLGNEEAIAAVLAEHFPGEDVRRRIVGGVAFLCSNRTAPGEIRHISYGHVRLAEMSGPLQPRTHTLARLFTDAGFACEPHDSLVYIRWEKLMWNIPFNGLGVGGYHASSDICVSDPELRRVSRGLMEEVQAAARGADGVVIPDAFIDKMISYTEAMGFYRSSMQIDYENGKPLEVEAILGEPLRRARRAGIDTPRMQMLYAIVKRMDAENRKRTATA